MLLIVGAVPGRAQELDLHGIFEARCSRCHGHAGDFARSRLALIDDVLVGRESGRSVAAFLPGHFGGLAPREVEAMTALFARQVAAQGLFQARCAICHVRARDLAHESLTLDEGRLVGRYSGRDIGAFLERHGRLSATERALVLERLRGVTQGR